MATCTPNKASSRNGGVTGRLSLLITIFIATSFGRNPSAQTFFNGNNQACCCIGNEKCGQNTRMLLADVLGIHPTGRQGCYEIEHCPLKTTEEGVDLEDAVLGVRVINDPPPNNQITSCPDGYLQCCYNSLEELKNTAGDLCGAEEEDWSMTCEENIRDTAFKQCGERPGFKPLSGLGQGESSPEEFPWACIIMDLSNRRIAHCVIIPNSISNDISEPTFQILTVAHRVKDYQNRANQLKVRISEYDLSGFMPTEQQPAQEFLVESIKVHSEYGQGRALSNNIAVLRLQNSIDLIRNPGINAACIPACEGMFDYEFKNGTGTRCWVIGWGDSKAEGNSGIVPRNEFEGASNVLRKADIPIMPEKDLCQQRINDAVTRQQGKRNTVHILDGEICAGGELRKDACTGDGGAPLMCQASGGRWYVVGLVGWGSGCGEDGVPGIYTRVAHYRKWLSGR